MVCVFGAERNREVLTNLAVFQHDETMFSGAEGSSIQQLNGMITCINGEQHRRHRRLITPAFARDKIAGYADAIVTITEKLVERLPRGEVIDLNVALREVALNVAVETLLGVDALAGGADLSALASTFATAVTSPTAMLLPYDLPGTPYRRAARLGDAMLAWGRWSRPASRARSAATTPSVCFYRRSRRTATASPGQS